LINKISEKIVYNKLKNYGNHIYLHQFFTSNFIIMPPKSKKHIAHTGRDQRYTFAHRIEKMELCCSKGFVIKSKQEGFDITLSCDCGVSSTTNCGIIFGIEDAICNFNDNHNEN